MEWAENVKKRLNAITVADAGREAARSVIPDMRRRIFDRGETPSGDQIGTYSTRPLYIDIQDMARTGLGRETRGGKSKYFEGGYAQYKAALGAKGFNLRNFGVMMRDFLSPMEIVSGTRLKLTFKQTRSEKIAAKYPQAFGFSPEERAKFNRVYRDELQKRLFRD